MSNLSQFVGGVQSRSPTAIVRYGSTAGAALQSVGSASAGLKIIQSGALTADTLSTIISLAGSGVVDYLVIARPTSDATGRTLRNQLIIDGVTVWDYTSSSSTWAQNYGVILIDTPIPYNASFLLKIACNVTESDAWDIRTKYRTV